jgi:UDP-glucose 4-epimerase
VLLSFSYFNAWRADANDSIGEQLDPKTHLLPNALKAACSLARYMKVVGTDYPTPYGTCLRDYVDVSDLADAHVAALDFMDRQGGFHAFNLGTGKPFSVLEILQAVEKPSGNKVPHDIGPHKAGDVAVLTADVVKACDLLGFSPGFSDIDTIVASAWAFHRKTWGLA